MNLCILEMIETVLVFYPYAIEKKLGIWGKMLGMNMSIQNNIF